VVAGDPGSCAPSEVIADALARARAVAAILSGDA